jgi:hypothetical protein
MYQPLAPLLQSARLDHLYKMVALIYNDQNIARSPAATFGHFVEGLRHADHA